MNDAILSAVVVFVAVAFSLWSITAIVNGDVQKLVKRFTR